MTIGVLWALSEGDFQRLNKIFLAAQICENICHLMRCGWELIFYPEVNNVWSYKFLYAETPYPLQWNIWKFFFYWYHVPTNSVSLVATYVFATTKYKLYHQNRSFISFVGRVLYLNWQAFSRGYWWNFAPIISLGVSHVSSSQISHQTRLQVSSGNINFWCAKCGCVLSCRFRIDRPPALHIFGAKAEMALKRILRTQNQYGEQAKKGS